MYICKEKRQAGMELRFNAGFWTISDIARAAGVRGDKVYKARNIGYIPAPKLVLVRRKYYSAEQAAEIVALLKKKYDLF
jgi:hypothetical protein